jgi:pseudouridylate synthase
MNTPILIITDEIAQAVSEGRPVVALETTIVSHGMPYPQNIETARLLEDTIREAGAVPATIAILEGKIHVGISDQQLEFLGTSKDIVKASRRDLPAVFAQKLHAATTVATTMICADMAGIRIFATGGVGGVHRGAQQSFDISADLQELARTDVAVISAGSKSILDLTLTMEYLETMGVPVLGYRTDELPAFYTRTSGLQVDYRIDTPQDAAAILHAKWDNGLHGGVMITNPIPEAFAMDKQVIDAAIEQALADADAAHIEGKRVTPFLLDRVKELTSGDSLAANIALVQHNAQTAAEIAQAYWRD